MVIRSWFLSAASAYNTNCIRYFTTMVFKHAMGHLPWITPNHYSEYCRERAEINQRCWVGEFRTPIQYWIIITTPIQMCDRCLSFMIYYTTINFLAPVPICCSQRVFHKFLPPTTLLNSNPSRLSGGSINKDRQRVRSSLDIWDGDNHWLPKLCIITWVDMDHVSGYSPNIIL